jgi:hypothetical protein
MRRFNYEDNEDFREDVDKFFNEKGESGITEEQFKAIMEEETIQELQIKFVYRDLNHRLLRTAIRTCEKSFWWWFRSQDARLKMIEKAYETLRILEEE